MMSMSFFLPSEEEHVLLWYCHFPRHRLFNFPNNRQLQHHPAPPCARPGQSIWNAKLDLLYAVSHEIRTPLVGIIGMIEMLKAMGPYDRETLKDINCLQICAKTLQTSISDILQFAKIEAQKLEVSIHPINVLKAVEKAVQESWSPQYSNILFSYRMHPDIEWEMGDEKLLAEAIASLLSNASKFTENGSVELSVSGEKEVILPKDAIRPNQARKPPENRTFISETPGSNGTILLSVGDAPSSIGSIHSMLLFKVKDTGPGIAQHRRQALFDARAHVQPTEYESELFFREGGTGLGLSIARSIVELMGGCIWCESPEADGEGSTFCFALPSTPVELTRAGSDSRESALVPLVPNAIPLRAIRRRTNSFGDKPTSPAFFEGGGFCFALVMHTERHPAKALQEQLARLGIPSIVLLIQSPSVWQQLLRLQDMSTVKSLLRSLQEARIPSEAEEVEEGERTEEFGKIFDVGKLLFAKLARGNTRQSALLFPTLLFLHEQVPDAFALATTLQAIRKEETWKNATSRPITIVELKSSREMEIEAEDEEPQSYIGPACIHSITEPTTLPKLYSLLTDIFRTDAAVGLPKKYVKLLPMEGAIALQHFYKPRFGLENTAYRELVRFSSPPSSSQQDLVQLAISQLSVLIADDNPINLEILLRMLEAAGVTKIFSASNGMEALNLFKKEQAIDLCVLDLHMPVLTGLQACKRILGVCELYSAAEEAPVGPPMMVALSASMSRQDRERARKSGFLFFILKPLTQREIILVLRQAATSSLG